MSKVPRKGKLLVAVVTRNMSLNNLDDKASKKGMR